MFKHLRGRRPEVLRRAVRHLGAVLLRVEVGASQNHSQFGKLRRADWDQYNKTFC